jgi:hypothetical protein
LNVVPFVVEEAVIVKVCPEQIGALVVIVTFAGDEGLTSVKGPTTLEGQPFKDTVTFEYVPGPRLSIVIVPVPVDVRSEDCC